MSDSRRLQNTPFLSLLPGSISDDATIKAVAASLDRVLHDTALAVPNLLLYSRLLLTAGGTETFTLLPALQRLVDARGGLKPLSTAELELLAWQFHVDFREVAKTDRELAGMIRESIPWHRIKGTPASIKRALALFGYGTYPAQDAPGRTAGAQQEPRFLQATASVRQNGGPSGITIEEDGIGDHWATYQLGLPQIATPEEVRHIVKICNEMAPVRCRLWRVYTNVFDRRPIVVGNGPKLGDGWLTFYSGTPVDVPGSGDADDSVLVSFGVRNAWQAEPYAPAPVCASFGATTHLGFQAPYLDRFIVGRSALSDVYPRNHGFTIGSLFSILWADRATTGRRWRGFWDARRWLDYTGFDRKLPEWRMGRRQISRAQLVPGWGEGLGDNNARPGAAFAVTIDAPGRLGAFQLSAHDQQRRETRLHEFFIVTRGADTPALNPQSPYVGGVGLLSSQSPVAPPERGQSAVHARGSTAITGDIAVSPPVSARKDWTGCMPAPVYPSRPQAGIHSRLSASTAPLRNQQWKGSWREGRRWWDYVGFARVGVCPERPAEPVLVFEAGDARPPSQPSFRDTHGTLGPLRFSANPAPVPVKVVFAGPDSSGGTAPTPLFRDTQGFQYIPYFSAQTEQ